MHHPRQGLLSVHAAVLIFSFTALFANGLLQLKAKTASLIACVQVVYTAFFAAIILGEWLTWNVIAGGLIVVSAAMYESLPKQRN